MLHAKEAFVVSRTRESRYSFIWIDWARLAFPILNFRHLIDRLDLSLAILAKIGALLKEKGLLRKTRKIDDAVTNLVEILVPRHVILPLSHLHRLQ